MGLLEEIKQLDYEKYFARTDADRRPDLPSGSVYPYAEVYAAWQSLCEEKIALHENIPVLELSDKSNIELLLQPESIVIEKLKESIISRGLEEKFVAAGGFLAYVCTQSGEFDLDDNAAPDDIDLFPMCTKDTANKAIIEFRKNTRLNGKIQLMVGTVTLKPCGRVKHQFILREGWKTAGGIMAGFDLDASQVCCVWDKNGKPEVFCTFAGALALISGTMILDATRYSPSFVSRITKYMNRGWKLAFPNLSDEMKEDTVLKLPGMKIMFDKEMRKKFMKVKIFHTDLPVISDYLSDDRSHSGGCWICDRETTFEGYDGIDIPIDGEEFLGECIPIDGSCWHFAANTKILKYALGVSKLVGWNICSKRSCLGTKDFSVLFDDAFSGELKVKNILSRNFVRDHIVTKYIYSSMETFDSGLLIRLLDIPEEKLKRVKAVSSLLKETPDHINIRIVDILADEVSEILPRVDAAAERAINFWMECPRGPGDQWTMALNLKSMTNKEWYGSHYKFNSSMLCSSAETVVKVAPRPRDPTQCAICLNEIIPGTDNTVILPCGHAFCFLPNKKIMCSGVWQCLVGNETCPMCRAPINPEETINGSTRKESLRTQLINYING